MIKLLYFRVVLILLTCISTIPVFSQVANVDVGLVCSNVNITAEPPEAMVGVDVSSFCSNGYSNRFRFYLVQIRSGSTFTFQLTPTGGGDYDFVSWKNPSLQDIHNITLADINNLPPGDRGNRNTGGQGTTIGLSLTATTTCNGVAGNGLERYYDVVPGDIVLIGIDDWSSNNPYTITFGGNAQLDCYFGKTFYECVDEETNLATFNLDSYIPEVRPPNDNSPHFFYESQEDAEANLPENRISNIQTLPYSEDGKEIFVAFVQPNGRVDVVKFNLKPLQPLRLENEIIYGCFFQNHPVTQVPFGTFNLREAIPAEFLSDQLVSVKFFRTLANAEANGTSGLIAENQWENHGAPASTYYVRLEYDLGEGNLKCTKILPLQLQIVRVELQETVKDLEVCYGEIINLTEFENYFAAEGTNYDYTYYSGTTIITNPASYEVMGSESIRVVIGKGSCISEATINITVLETPFVEFYDTFTVCDTDFNGSYEIDLGFIRSYLGENVGEYNYTFFLSEDDATNQNNPIEGGIVQVPIGQSLWVRASSGGRCFSIAEVPVQMGEAITFTEPTVAIEECINPEGVTFNLTNVLPQLALSTGVTVKYFPTREDAVALTNEITNPLSWTTTENSGTLYIRLTEEGKCDAIVPFQFNTIDLPTIEIVEEVVFCEGETYTLDLSSYTNYTFTISGNVTEVSTKVYQITEAGTYTITVATASGCFNTYNVVATEVTVPTFAPFDAIEVCDDNFNGQYEINLAQVRTIAQANVGNAYTIKLYPTEADANADTNEIVGDVFTVNTLPSKVWIRANSQGECFGVSSIDVITGEEVAYTATNQVLEVCEVEGGTVLNLTSMASFFNVANGVTIKYFTSLDDAQANTNAIANPAAYTPADLAGVVFVRFEQEGFCTAITSFSYLINPLPAITIDTNIEICEGDTYVLDLSAYADYTITVTGGTVRVLRANVYELSSAATYTINVATAAGCTKDYTVTVTVNPLPVFTNVNTYNVCDTNVDGDYELDLVALSGLVLENNTGVTLGFYASEADLLADRNEITTDIYLTRLPAQIWVKATTASGCFVHKAITLVEGDSINVAPATRPLEVCEGPNGVNEFDLSLIRPQFSVPSGYILSYYPTLADLQNGTNEILNPTVWTTSTTSGTIYVKFEAAGLCPGYSTFEYVVNENPEIEIENKYYICEDEEFVLDLSRYSNYTITVTGENVVNLGNRRYRLSTFGMYTVNVTNDSGCTTEYVFELANFPPPVVSEIIIAATTITVNVVRDPSYTPGLLQYSLDGINYQTSNVLDIPQRGRSYDIYIKVGNCVYMIQSVEVIDIPTFFSPNNDGINDVWKIRPISLTQNVDLKIFDRFGKILYEQNDNQDIRWDGKVNGKPLPTTDYWFTIDIVGDGVVQAIRYTGSITLKNKE